MNRSQLMKRAGVFGGALAASGLALAVDPTTAEEAIGSAKTAVLAIVAVGGIAMVVVSLAGVGYGVASKFIKRVGRSS